MRLEVVKNLLDGVLRRWDVRPGESVEEGQVLGEVLSDAGKTHMIQAPQEGTVSELLVAQGQRAEDGVALLSISICPHDIQFQGLCGQCGIDLSSRINKKPTMPIIHNQPGVTITLDQAKRVEEETAARLRANRKLSLVLDLDHTLIHAATEEWFFHSPHARNIDLHAEQIHAFQLPRVRSKYYVKLRPGLAEFLIEANKLFETHMYTFGTKSYAAQIARIIDPTQHIFKERILSRDECGGDITTKNLKRIFPCNDSMVVIVDDREDVWRKSRNLVSIEPFHYFTAHEINARPANNNDPLIKHSRPPAPHQASPSHKHKSRHHSRHSNGKGPTTGGTPDSSSSPGDSSAPTKNAKPVEEALPSKDNDEPSAAKDVPSASLNGEVDSDASVVSSAPPKPVDTPTNTYTTPADTTTNPHTAPANESSANDVMNLPNSTQPADNATENGSDTNGAHTSQPPPQPQPLPLPPPQHQPPNIPPRVDNCLEVTLQILKKIHKRFYSSPHNEGDVKEIITNLKKEVLSGVHVVFSGFCPSNVDPRTSTHWKAAQSCGAVCQTEVDGDTTHVIAHKKGTVKVHTALKTPGVFLVNEHWLWKSASKWQKQAEEEYSLEGLPVLCPPKRNTTTPSSPSTTTTPSSPPATTASSLPLAPPDAGLMEDMDREVDEFLADDDDADGEAEGKDDGDEDGDKKEVGGYEEEEEVGEERPIKRRKHHSGDDAEASEDGSADEDEDSADIAADLADFLEGELAA